MRRRGARGAPRPITGIALGEVQTRMGEPFGNGGVGDVEVDVDSVRPEVEVERGEPGDLEEGGLDGADNTPP